MDRQASASVFQLPDKTPERIRSFHDLWLAKAGGGLPQSSEFDLPALSADYPLLARIGVEGPEKKLIWRELAATELWPFGPPVENGPVAESVPALSVKRVADAFRETLESGIPDYFETTSWFHGGRSLSLARLVAPIAAGAGRELIALWEVMEPPVAL
ncbi:MAG: hypothetical protein VR78_17235 [Hoeflea sp. BRH_c9]|nr:MAG: hypothetical protein VR78_17235 [Hoeflea sp. BRH_c9]